jgi:hypothetical protein
LAGNAIAAFGRAMTPAASPRSPADFATPQSGHDFFLTEAHRRSVAERIIAALGGERALVVVTGDPPPSGPDLAAALGAASRSRYRVVMIGCNPELGPEMLRRAASRLAEPAPDASARHEASLLSRARSALPLFLLDEAERLSDAQLGAIALTAEFAVAAVVLLAAAGFRARLEAPPARSVNERLAAAFSFEELGGEEIEAFIRHQLGGGVGEGAFSTDIVAAIGEAAGGDPALVNLLARYVLDYATTKGEMPPRSLLAGAPGLGKQRLPAAAAMVPAFLAAAPAHSRARAVVAAHTTAASAVAAKRLFDKGPLLLAFVAGLAVAGGAALLFSGAERPADRGPHIQADPQASLPAAEIATLLRRGDKFLAAGDIASARLFYKPAAAAGNGHAALRLAETYDPGFLHRVGVRGVPGDLRLARKWYRRARALTSSAALPGGRVAPSRP